MMKRLLLNLLNGARLALLRDCSDDAFDTSWPALWFIVAVFAAYTIGFDFLEVEPPREFYADGFVAEFATLGILMLAGSVTALAFRRPGRSLAVVVVLYNAILVPWLVQKTIFTMDPGWLQGRDAHNALYNIFGVWYFLTAFRAVTLNFDPAPVKQLLGGVLLLAAMLAPSRYVYFDDFWYRDYSEREQSEFDKTSHEKLFGIQHALIDRQVETMRPSAPGTVDAFGIVLGSFGYQDVFKREVAFVADTLANAYGMKDRVIRLLNNEDTVLDLPLAMAANLEYALKTVAAKMQTEEDILILYTTSHGSARNGLAVTLDYGMRFENLDAKRIGDALDVAGIENRVIFVSACYSGSMIPALQNPRSLVMTAAAEDRESYGCSDVSDMTFFAHAYFRQALPQADGLIEAFEIAKHKIREREDGEGLEKHSDPQIFVGSEIVDVLEKYDPNAGD